MAYHVRVTAGDNVVVVGSTGSFGEGSSDVYLFEVDIMGERLWSKTLGGPQIEEARSFVVLDDGGFLIAGTTNDTPSGDYDGLFIRTDAEGELLWQRGHGGPDWDFIYSVEALSDGGALACGLTYSYGTAGKAWIVRLDPSGDTLWTAYPDGQQYSDARSVKMTLDGGCVVAGAELSTEGDLDVLVMKYDFTGGLEWQYTYGGDDDDFARDIILTNEGGYSILGVTNSMGPVTEMYHLKISDDGSFEWEKNWGQISHQEGYRHLQLVTGEYASIGFVTQGGQGGKEMFLQKTTETGDYIFGQTQGGINDDIGHSLLEMAGGYLLCGITQSFGSGLWDIFLVRTDEVGFTASDEVITSFDPLDVTDNHVDLVIPVYPNPNSGTFQLSSDLNVQKVVLYDASGRVAFDKKDPPNAQMIHTDLSPGLYQLEAFSRSGDRYRTRILILER